MFVKPSSSLWYCCCVCNDAEDVHPAMGHYVEPFRRGAQTRQGKVEHLLWVLLPFERPRRRVEGHHLTNDAIGLAEDLHAIVARLGDEREPATQCDADWPPELARRSPLLAHHAQ